MAKPTYVSPNGARISRDEWVAMQNDRSIRILCEYDNGQVYVRLEWRGEVEDASVFRDCWKVFVLTVANYNENGDLVADPVENGKTFAYRGKAIAAYESFLARWTASHIDEDGQFVEEDNTLTPPPPPNPDAPTSAVAEIKGMEDDGVGAW